MNLLPRALTRPIRAMFRSAGKMLFQGYGGQGYGWRLLLPGAQYDYEAAAGDLWRNTAVAACLGWVKKNFPEPKLEQVEDQADGTEKIEARSQCVKLLNRPNQYFGRYTFWSACSLSGIVDGNIYIRIVRSGAGVPVELWWIPHWLIWPRWNPDGSEFLGWYEYNINGRIERIPIEDIVHIRFGIDPRDDRRGFSELKQAVRQIVGLNECDTYTAAILRNMGIPGVIISPGSPDVSMTTDDIDEFKSQWRENYTSEGRGDPLVGTRMFKVEKLSLTPEELSLDKLPARLEDQICACIGLPPMVVGLTSGAQHKTYANYGEARRAAYEDCLIPLQKMIAEELTIQLLPQFPDTSETCRLRWDYAGVQCLAENETEVAERVGKAYAVYKGIKRSEYRQALGYDWTPEDEVYFEAGSAEGAEPDGDEAVTADSTGLAVTDKVQDQALNGAQITSLVAICEAVGSGVIPHDSAVAMLIAAFPGVPLETIHAIVDPIEVKEPEPEPAPQLALPAPATESAIMKEDRAFEHMMRVLNLIERELQNGPIDRPPFALSGHDRNGHASGPGASESTQDGE